MYRQIIVLFTIILAANALDFTYTQGARQDGDKPLGTMSAQALAPGYPDVASEVEITLSWPHAESDYFQVTFVSHEVFQGFDEVEQAGPALAVRFTNLNTTKLEGIQTIYGFEVVPDSENVGN